MSKEFDTWWYTGGSEVWATTVVDPKKAIQLVFDAGLIVGRSATSDKSITDNASNIIGIDPADDTQDNEHY